ncbi:uncharacterized protein LOC117330397 [Pecten maximus]|uniref:uncharacterized protein LOC117330397 n=1 Tax=Pecten maximus TaxID=6579 RepID=UPI0014587E2E|nr:uncharacterized protein LOC117330397 [Pecten maximus]
MDPMVPNFGHVGQQCLGHTSQNHVGQPGVGQNSGQVTYEDLDRPAKELTLEVLYQLSLKLQNMTRGNWASLAEIMGYSRDKIDEFDHQSTAEYKPPGYLVLRDWTKQERGRSIYVLLESLKQCGRLDCVVFLEQAIKNLLSMKLHLKITDETVPCDTVKPYFLTVPTRCQATLKDSLENVFGGELQDYEICAAWTDRAHQFKGMHLSVRRKRRSGKGISLTTYLECTHYRNQEEQNNLSEPNQQLTGRYSGNACPHKSVETGERHILGDKSGISREHPTGTQTVRNISVDDHKRCIETCPGHKDYVSEECLYCGKFKTFSQKTVHSLLDKEINNRTLRKIESGLHCRSCTCELSEIGSVSCLGRERFTIASHRTDTTCNVTRTEQEGEATRRKLSDDSDNENVVSSTTDMDVDMKGTNNKSDLDKISPETSGYKSFQRVSSHAQHCQDFHDDDLEQTFVKAPYHSQTHCKLVRVVTENITMENDTEGLVETRPHVMGRSVSDTTASYQRLNRETMTYKETNIGRFTFDNVQVMHGHNLGTIGDMFTRQHRSPIEHCDDADDVFKNANSDMDATHHSTPRVYPHEPDRTQEVEIPISDNGRTNTVSPRFNFPETHTMSYNVDDICPQPTEMQTVPPLPARKVDRCHQISSSRQDTPPTLPPRNNRPAPYPSSRSGGADSKFVHLNKVLGRYLEWSPRDNENTVENKMRHFINSDGHYLLWYMASKKKLVLTVSHLRKLIHYAIYMTQENGQLSYFIFKGETFPDLHKLLYHYKHYGLKPASLQGCHSNDFLQQQNGRGSFQMARLSHVELLHPVTQSRGRTSV